MMSTAKNLQIALLGAKSAYDAWSRYSDRKAQQAYASLADAAEAYGPVADNAAESAREGLDKASKKSSALLKDVRSDGKKLSRRGRRKAEKAAKRAEKARKTAAKRVQRRNKKGLGWFGKLSLTALIAAVASAVAYFVANNKRKAPAPLGANADNKLKGDETFSKVEPTAVKFQSADSDAENKPATEPAPEADTEVNADTASTENADEVLKGDETFSDVEPTEVKVQSADDANPTDPTTDK